MPDSKFKNKNQQSMNAQSTEKSSLVNKLGDVVEKVGHMVSEAGAPGLGQKIHDLGDKLETKHTNPSHPHKA